MIMLNFLDWGDKMPDTTGDNSVIEFSDIEADADEIGSYRQYVKRIAAAADGNVILNRSPEHAAVIVEQVFLSSEHEVDILTSELNESVYGTDHVTRAAIEFLTRHPNAHVRVLSEKPIADQHIFLAALSNAGVGNRLKLSVVPKDEQQSYKYNFAVGDGYHFRFEKDRCFFDAVVQFGAPSVGAKLQSIFERLQQRAS